MNANKHSLHFTDSHFTYVHSTAQWFVYVKYTYTCDVYNKTLGTVLQLKALPHTPQEYGHFPQHMLWWMPISTALTSQTRTSRIFTPQRNDLYMFFHSRTTCAPLQTKGLLSGSCEQLSHYTNAAAVNTALWYVTLHTISMQWIMSAEGRIGVILGWQSMGRLGLLVRFFLFLRCTYTCTCAVCNKGLRISLTLKALLLPAQVYALSLSHWWVLIHTNFLLQIFAVSTIIWTCFLLQGQFNCHRQMSW
jgi:hypothetical protein